MKKTNLLTVLAISLVSLNMNAQHMIPGGPGVKGPKLPISEEELIQMIKNDKGSGKSKSSSISFGHLFEEDSTVGLNDEELFEKLKERLDQEGMVKYYDDKSLQDVFSFSALAYQAWNPELTGAKIKTQIIRNTINFGFMQGFASPIMQLIDVSYATEKPQFGNLLNVMLADIAPGLARSFEVNYGIPTTVHGLNFSQISMHGRDYMWQVLFSQFQSEIHANFNPKSVDGKINERINPINQGEKSMDRFIGNTVKSKNSYLGEYFKKIGHESKTVPTNSGLSVAQKKQNADKFSARRGVFSNMVASETQSCMAKCMDEVGNRASKHAEQFGKAGAAIGGGIGIIGGGPIGAAAGAAKGGAIGGLVGAIGGAAVGVAECSKSTQCGGDRGNQSESSNKDKEAKLKEEIVQKEKQAKEQKEQQEKVQKEQLVKEQKEQKEKLQKEKAELERKQKAIKEEQEKYKNDMKKQAELKKRQEELDKQKAELKKKEEKEQKEKQEQQQQKDKDQVKGVSVTKAMQDDGEVNKKMTLEEQLALKIMISTPMTPVDDFSGGGGNLFREIDQIKVLDKNKNYDTAPQKPVLVYPKNPNAD